MSISLQEALDKITTLARRLGATISHSCQLEFNGCAVSLFWDCTDNDETGTDLPRQVGMFFEQDGFALGWLYHGHRFIQCLDDGLTEEQAKQESRRIVASFDDILKYLTNRPYRFLTKEDLHAARK